MSDEIMEPLRLQPAFKDYLWGGTRLRTEFAKQCDYEKIAESWELSCHKDGASVIANGAYAGQTLAAYLQAEQNAPLGTHAATLDAFPVLIKLIDAKDNLSVQVHPDNAYAQRVEGEYGKTEMWYIVDCEPDSTLLYGFTHAITREEFRSRIQDNTLLDVVNRVPVHRGDVFFIEAGTLHAIGKGILIAEIQQNSNTTYRVYDYGRVGADGKPRALHLDRAAEVTTLAPAKPYPPQKPHRTDGAVRTLLSQCPYFTVHQLELTGAYTGTVTEQSFLHLLILSGTAQLQTDAGTMTLTKGDSIFLPASLGVYTLTGNCQIITTSI